MKVLLVEDNVRLKDLVSEELIKHGFVIDGVSSLADAKDMFATFQYDLILLDLSLPDGDGLDLLKLVTSKKNPPPILVITARSGLDDRITGLNLGADDYLVKPFAPEELIARCRTH
jgi:DNA-binding response OmpR family regulator